MRKVLIALVVMFSVACLGDGLTGSSTVNGAYTLRTINGAGLPYTIVSNATSKTEIVDDVITLFQGGTYDESGHSRTTLNGQVSNESNSETGSYVLLGTSVTFQSSDRTRSRLMTIAANAMTFVEPGMTSVFSK